MSPLSSIAAAGGRATAFCLRAPSAALAAGGALDGRLRSELRSTLGAARGLFGSALDAALVDAIDALAARLLSDEAVDRALARLEQTGVAQRVAARMLADGIAEQIAQRALAGPETERMLAAAFQGPLVEEAVAHLIESQALWVLVEEIARSPSVTEAIAHQGSGFMDQVAERLRDRSRTADTRVQRLADRLAHVRSGASDGQPSGLARVRSREDDVRPAQR